MTDRIAPNPPSPYADADPEYRHLIPSFFGIGPVPGGLALTACGFLAVVPREMQDVRPLGNALPEGMCPKCIDEMHRQTARQPEESGPAGPPHQCTRCESTTLHDGLCALCRQELHDEWCATQPREASA